MEFILRPKILIQHIYTYNVKVRYSHNLRGCLAEENAQKLENALMEVFFFSSSLLGECSFLLGLLRHLEPILTSHGDLGMVVGVFGGVDLKNHTSKWVFFFFFLLLLFFFFSL